MKGLIDKCWSQNPDHRPSFDEIYAQLSTDFSYLNEKLDEEKIKEYIKKVCCQSEIGDTRYLAVKSQIDDLKSRLLSACEEGNAEQVFNIVSLNIINVNCKYKIGNDVKTLLHMAVEKENIDIIKILLGCEDIDINAKATYAYPYEMYEEKDDIIEIQKDIDKFEEIIYIISWRSSFL